MTEFVTALSRIVPTYLQPAPAEAVAPYAVFTVSESFTRTKSGIAGAEGTISLVVVAPKVPVLDNIVQRIVEVIDDKRFDGMTMYVTDVDMNDYPEMGLMTKELTINTLR